MEIGEVNENKVIISETTLPVVPTLLRVAFYVRVSNHTEGQMHSFENQKTAVEVVLKQHPEFQLVKIYADAGITGTLAEKRPGFMEMITDCKAGKIDLIYTKSLSRWSRNTVDCLHYYRILKEIGVDLIFEKENLDTRNAFTEMVLSIYASFAQEESHSISENMKMAIRWRFEMGECRWVSIYGYKKGYVIDESAAEIVRKMYDMYEHGASINDIIKYLNDNHIPSPRNGKWSARTVNNILKNDKYTGDLVMQKYYTVDHLSHRRVKNDGTLVPIYTIPDHHDAIISREQFGIVQAIIKMRLSGMYGRSQYPFGDKLICPYCKKSLKQRDFQHIVWAIGRGWECVECHEFLLKSKAIEDAVWLAFTELDMDDIEAHIGRMNPEKRKAAEQLAEFKKNNEVTALHYFWIDRLIRCIEFGTFASKPDRVLMVRWRFGLTSTRPIRTRKTPKEYAAMIGVPRPKSNNPGIKNLVQSQRKRKSSKSKKTKAQD